MNANQRGQELESAQRTHARLEIWQWAGRGLRRPKSTNFILAADLKAERERSHDVDMKIAGIQNSQEKITLLEQDRGVANRQISTLTADFKAANEHGHDVDIQIAGFQSSENQVTILEGDLRGVKARITAFTADLRAANEHSNDVDAQTAGHESSQEKVTVLEEDLGVAKERIAALTAELTAAKEHSHNVGTPRSAQLQELESNITARDEHLDRVIDDNTILMDGIKKSRMRTSWRGERWLDSKRGWQSSKRSSSTARSLTRKRQRRRILALAS